MGDEVISLRDVRERLMFLDPASGKVEGAVKSVRARSAIVCIGLDELGRIYVLECWANRAPTSEIVETYVDIYERWLPAIAGMEDFGQQFLLYEPIRKEAERRGLDIPLVALRSPRGVEKKFRIRTSLQPLIKAGRLLWREDQIEWESEVRGFPMSSVLDLLDAMASCVAMIAPRTSREDEDTEVEELLRYLRMSGVPAAEIEMKAAELRGESATLSEASPWKRLQASYNEAIRKAGMR